MPSGAGWTWTLSTASSTGKYELGATSTRLEGTAPVYTDSCLRWNRSQSQQLQRNITRFTPGNVKAGTNSPPFLWRSLVTFPEIAKKTGAQGAAFIRQLKRRDESGHAVFHIQDSRKATQGAILVRNAGKWNAHTEKNPYRSALFRRILKETGRLEFILMLSP